MNYLLDAAIFFGAAVIAVPIAKRFGLGSVLGYLGAGMVIGPWGLRLITGVDEILHFAELGVVFLLFLIGIELQPRRLWVMRRTLFGLGFAQVLVTAVPVGVAAWFYTGTATAAIVIGFTLALSSTAFALQTLSEKKQLTTRHGRAAFGILLFQDIAVIPLLAVIPLFGMANPTGAFSWLALAKTVAILAAVVFLGRYAVRYLFRIVAETEVREIFTALALLIVLGTAVVVEQSGLSMALGAFMAGVLLSESEYRHAIEADIDPFKNLLLGLFFISVGMSVNFGLLQTNTLQILIISIGLMLIKFVVLAGLGRAFGLTGTSAIRLAAFLPQGGEFAFIILAVALQAYLVPGDLVDTLILSVTLTMALTPPLVSLVEAIQNRTKPVTERGFDSMPEEQPRVIVAGFGRVGQIVARILRAKKIGFTALDNSPGNVDFVKRYGNKVYYGDASRIDLLRSAQADKAALLVLTISNPEISLKTAEAVRRHFPHLKILARARNRKHAYQLMDLGVTHIWRDTFYSSLKMAEATLESLGLSRSESTGIVETFRKHDEQRLRDDHHTYSDEKRMVYLAKQAARELEEMFEEDEKEEKVD